MIMMKRGIAFLAAGIMLLASPVSVLADREDAKLEKPYVSLGADLNAQERATVLELLGVTEDDLKNYTVATITNQDEHDYLDAYLDKSVIGSRALSSVLGRQDGRERNQGNNSQHFLLYHRYVPECPGDSRHQGCGYCSCGTI